MGDTAVVETAQVDDLIQQVERLQQQLAEKETLLEKAQYHIHVLQQLLFGKRSERLTKEEAKGRGSCLMRRNWKHLSQPPTKGRQSKQL